MVVGQLSAQRKDYSDASKAYNGFYVFYDQINKIFPVADVDNTFESIATKLDKKTYNNSSYIIVYREFNPTTKDLIALKDFIKEGNHVLLVVSDFNERTYQFFKFNTNTAYAALGNGLSFKQDGLETLGKFTSKRITGYVNYFTKIDSTKTDILGVNENGKPNFIQQKIGSGTLLVHLYPEVLLNYFLVEKQNYKYTEALLSYLPRNTDKIIIKISKSQSSAGSSYNGESDKDPNRDFMSFIRSERNLWWALLLGLAIFGLVVLFGFKRRQRLIPVQQPIVNNTLEFAKTIGDLYFNQKNNADIANKKITYWQELVRAKYLIPTSKMETEFWDKLSKKSGADSHLLKQLESNIVAVRNNATVNDYLLIQLSNNIDQFNKT
jgi:hypothetical protein